MSMVGVPKISIGPELTVFPSRFRADAGQIGDFMKEQAGLPEEDVFATQLEFVRGSSHDPVVKQLDPLGARFNMQSIYTHAKSGRLRLNHAWLREYPEDDLQAKTHFVLAGQIAMMKAIHETGATEPSKWVRGGVGLTGALAGIKLGHEVSDGNDLATLGGLVAGQYTALVTYIHRFKRRAVREHAPITDKFMSDRGVAAVLKGALSLDYRG